jgi:hypothetical protein
MNTPGQNGKAVVQFNGITTVGITTGTGNDNVTVINAPMGVQLSISTGGGSDTVNLGQSGGKGAALCTLSRFVPKAPKREEKISSLWFGSQYTFRTYPFMG